MDYDNDDIAIFSEVDGLPTPQFPWRDGSTIRPDGERTFSVAQAARRFGRSPFTLMRQYLAAFRQILPTDTRERLEHRIRASDELFTLGSWFDQVLAAVRHAGGPGDPEFRQALQDAEDATHSALEDPASEGLAEVARHRLREAQELFVAQPDDEQCRLLNAWQPWTFDGAEYGEAAVRHPGESVQCYANTWAGLSSDVWRDLEAMGRTDEVMLRIRVGTPRDRVIQLLAQTIQRLEDSWQEITRAKAA